MEQNVVFAAILLLVAAVSSSSNIINPDLLYPYGKNLDYSSPNSDDGDSPLMKLDVILPLYGNNYSSLYVNYNGLISFKSPDDDFTPEKLPLVSGNPFLAPFWADVDISYAGDIFYNQRTDKQVLSRATSDIRTYFGSMDFTAQWVFTATWDRVSYYGSTSDKVNTFQVVLCTDKVQTFVMFNYANITWTTGVGSGGNSKTGLEGVPALAGLDSGEVTGYFIIPGSLNSSIVNISTTTNVDVVGRWAFKVDQLHPGFPLIRTVTTTPAETTTTTPETTTTPAETTTAIADTTTTPAETTTTTPETTTTPAETTTAIADTTTTPAETTTTTPETTTTPAETTTAIADTTTTPAETTTTTLETTTTPAETTTAIADTTTTPAETTTTTLETTTTPAETATAIADTTTTTPETTTATEETTSLETTTTVETASPEPTTTSEQTTTSQATITFPLTTSEQATTSRTTTPQRTLFPTTSAHSMIDLLYPYGPQWDNVSPKIDDGGPPAIRLNIKLPVFGSTYSTFYLSNNGHVSSKDFMQYTPEKFPLPKKIFMITPYWSDVDNRISGDIYYRQSTDPALLSRATSDINSYFHGMNFTASWVFVATWKDVPFFGSTSTKVNNFQLVLISNGNVTFTLYNYVDLQWTTGTISGGDKATGLGGTPALAGLNSGSSSSYYQMPGSLTSDILLISSKSNVHIPGRWAFKIDKIFAEDINGILNC
ncbi:serine-rich adhesin for platelets-like [Hyla sarda]|uniref:serine-rich adhesin for platelets-like n=1 Tax=Hyla sarda TaxID=327740 RepID=UPI0024C429CA|nr:serine-rich adhesin for platelets-like [Hyla sarda]